MYRAGDGVLDLARRGFDVGIESAGGTDVLLEFRLVFAQVVPEARQPPPLRRREDRSRVTGKIRDTAKMRFQRVLVPGSIMPPLDVRKVIHGNQKRSEEFGSYHAMILFPPGD